MTIKKLLNTYSKNNVKKEGGWITVTLIPTFDQIRKNPFILQSKEVERKILNIEGLSINTYMTDDYRDEAQHPCLLIRYELPEIFENLTSYQWLEANKNLFNTNNLVTLYCEIWNSTKEKKIDAILKNLLILKENNFIN